MRRIKLVLAVAIVAAMFVAASGPAMADISTGGNERNFGNSDGLIITGDDNDGFDLDFGDGDDDDFDFDDGFDFVGVVTFSEDGFDFDGLDFDDVDDGFSVELDDVDVESGDTTFES